MSAAGSSKPSSRSIACRARVARASPAAIGRNMPSNGSISLARAELVEGERRSRDIAQNRTILRPSSAEIAEMEAAFDWLRELRAVDSGMALVASLWAFARRGIDPCAGFAPRNNGRRIPSIASAPRRWPISPNGSTRATCRCFEFSIIAKRHLGEGIRTATSRTQACSRIVASDASRKRLPQ